MNDNNLARAAAVAPISAETILHPVRMRIILALAQGRALTAQQLGVELPDVPQATLYRHLNRLFEAGVLAVQEEHQVRGAVERVYTLRSEDIDASIDVLSASPQDNMRYFAMFLGGLLGEFARYLQRERVDPPADGIGYRQEVLYLSDDEFTRFLAALNALLAPGLANGPAPGRKRRIFTRIFMPATEAHGTNSMGDEAKKQMRLT